MAKKPSGRQPSADRILDAALALAGEMRWRDVTMERIAAKSGATLDRVYALYPSRAALLSAFIRRIDQAVLKDHDPADAGEPVHDRLLDVLMRRFDALGPYKDAVRSIVRDAPSEPASAICTMPAMMKSMAWSLEAAGISAGGPAGMLKTKGLAAVYASAFRTWLGDDSEDLSPTMAQIDKNLKRAGRVMSLLPFNRKAQD